MRLVARCFWEPSGRHPCALDARPTREDEMSQRVALRASAAVTRPLLRTPAPTCEAKAPKLSTSNDTHPSVVRCGCATHRTVIRPGTLHLIVEAQDATALHIARAVNRVLQRRGKV